MKIYRIKAAFDENGDNRYRHLFPVSASDLWEKTGPEDVLNVRWGEGDQVLPIGDFIRISSPVFCGEGDLVRAIQNRFAPRAIVQKLLIEGEEDKFMLLRPFKQVDSVGRVDHLFTQVDGLPGILASDVFREFWMNAGMSGLEFVEVGELPDARFELP